MFSILAKVLTGRPTLLCSGADERVEADQEGQTHSGRPELVGQPVRATLSSGQLSSGQSSEFGAAEQSIGSLVEL